MADKRRITIRERKLKGFVGQVEWDSTQITVDIDPDQKAFEWLGTLVHEALHVAQPRATERTILKQEKVITPILWKAGIRRIHQ